VTAVNQQQVHTHYTVQIVTEVTKRFYWNCFPQVFIHHSVMCGCDWIRSCCMMYTEPKLFTDGAIFYDFVRYCFPKWPTFGQYFQFKKTLSLPQVVKCPWPFAVFFHLRQRLLSTTTQHIHPTSSVL